MLAIERRNSILEKLQTDKRVVVSELGKLYGVSEETIRRDLEKLENEGLVIKSYGGAVLNEHSIFDMPFNIRKNQMIVEKQKIADMVVDMVRDGEAIMLDASSTATCVARALKGKKQGLTIVTNSVEIILELFDMPEWNVISTGGIAREKSLALYGPNTNRMISSYYVDKAIISCKALNLRVGIMDSDEQDACSKRLMLNAAKERILVADHSKFDKMAFAKVADWTDVTKVVTDRKVSQDWEKEFERFRVDSVYPGKNKMI